ncbi:MAG: HAMP domain-containing histidine kinase [Bacillaceae bacterium]|nr:HAMP domain-containing histidine kinase [Bacillaceae bacterium]
MVQGKYLFETIRDMRSLKEEWDRSILISIYKNITDFILVRSIATQLIILIGFFGSGLAMSVFVGMVEPWYVVPFLLAFVVVCIPVFTMIFLRIAYLNRIIINVDEIVKGASPTDLPIKGRSVFAKLAENINTLKQGVKSSQVEQLKSERLKTELITNVSHDLRTPLTSIITYTELLKGSNVSSDDRNAYIEIIDRKSKRLKVLIDDLFEASKMASGNIELVKEKVDIVQLLQQALAEYNESMQQSTLQFRITNPDKPIYVYVDGQKMWRVFDNLIANTLKYSLENTRVYLSVNQLEDSVLITFKNVTKYELGDNIDELFERFKRGDTSRQTEGSGLGLAIAKSIVDLHQGQLDIGIDGDLFKVSVKIPTNRG